MDNWDWKTILTVLGSVLSSSAVGFWAWMRTRVVASKDPQSTINIGFAALVTELQQERAELMVVVNDQTKQIVGLRLEVHTLSRQAMRLSRELEKNGIPIPNGNGAH